MGRSLNATENKVLDQLRDTIGAIVNAGDLNCLQATRLLGDPAANQQAYTDFHRRFQQVPGQLQHVRAAGRVQVNPDLDPSMGANTPTSVQNGAAVASVELTADFVSDSSDKTVTERAITLIHELSHTIYEAPDFPVKDFAYRDSWALGYLAGAMGARNADTYAEAAAQIAEDIEHSPGRYREGARVPAQRQALNALQPGLILGPALAWADMKINRAWLRGGDYHSFAKSSVARLIWSSTLSSWQANPETAGLLAIETGLRVNMGGLVGDRDGVFMVSLGDPSVLTTKNIRDYMAALKDTLVKAKPTLGNAGAAITYTPATKVLDVPRALVTGDSAALGELIVDAIVGSSNYTDPDDPSTGNLNAHKRAIVDLLASNDRPYETQHVQVMRQVFQGIHSAAAPAQAAWDSAIIDLDLATAKGIAGGAQRTSYAAQAAMAPGPLQQHLATLHQSLQPDINNAVQIGNRYTGPGAPALSPAQTQARRENFTALMHALADICGAAANVNSALVPTYNNFISTLSTFTA